MDKPIHKKDKKIIVYPNVVERLLEKGMDALKQHNGHEAYEFFLQAEEYEPDHTQVLYGKMLSLVELGKLEEAVHYTESFLNKGIGEYYENLQVHISLLVQLGRYEEVVSFLDAVLSENRIPAQNAESLYQLLHFSRQMILDEEDWHSSAPVEFDTEMVDQLQSESQELRSRAVQHLIKSDHPDATKGLVGYVERGDADRLLRNMALQGLRERGYDQVVKIPNGEQCIEIVPTDIDDDALEAYSQRIVDTIRDRLDHENPILSEMANALHLSHRLAVYPFPLEPNDPELWASVFEYCAAERLGLTVTTALESDHSDSMLREKVREVKELEQKVHFNQNKF